MNPKLEKLRAERDRLAERYASIGARLKNLDEQITNIENTDIIGIARSTGVTIEQLIRLTVYVKGKNARKYRKNEEYGSVRWGMHDGIAPFVGNVSIYSQQIGDRKSRGF